MARYQLGTVGNLARQLKVMHGKMPKETTKALQRAARGSVAAVQLRASSGSRPVVDTGQYLRSFTVRDLSDGAILFTAEPYSVVIEVGRRPGSRPPPRGEIRDWLQRKRLIPRPKKKVGKKRTKKPQKAKSPGQQKEKTAKRRVKSLSIHKIKEEDVEGIVRAVVMKIARKGIKGRFPMRKALPDMRKILAKELDVAVKKSMKPRGR